MKVLVAFEESQVVTSAFLQKGHDAYSCDLEPCSGPYPERHVQDDAMEQLDKGWDLLIAHPPCTYLAVSGLHWNKKDPDRARKTEEALEVVRELMNAPIEKIAIENPVSCISSRIRKPDQIVQPYQFGHDASKKTCLWLHELPPLIPTEYVPGRMVNSKMRWANQTDSGQNRLGPSEDRAKIRSRTYEGIAKAMADQWTL